MIFKFLVLHSITLEVSIRGEFANDSWSKLSIKTIELGGKYVCSVRFENVDAHWQTMYGTVIGYYREMDNAYNGSATSWVEELPEYDQPDESNEDSGKKTIDNIVPVESSTTQSGTSYHSTSNNTSLYENGAESNPDIVIF